MTIKRLLLAVLAIAVIGSNPAAAQTQVRTAGPLVLAAASLQESLTAVADAWAAKGHARPVVSFAASSALARQVEAGAPADIFISADEDWMNYLAERNAIRPKSRFVMVENALVLVAPAASKAKLRPVRGFPLARALGDARLAMADPDAVPAGRYGKAALQSLGVWDAVAPKVASAENVRAALALVERGEAPFGIVYATDAAASTKVRVVGTFPASSHPPIRYPAAIVAASKHGDAPAFLAFLRAKQARSIFAHYGFVVR